MDMFHLPVDFEVIVFTVVVAVVVTGIYKLISFIQGINKIEADSLQYGGQLVAHVLRCHGVKNIFTLVGGHISPILVAAEAIGMKVVDTRHEATAVFAADAAARLTGNVGVAVVTAGPGVTNTVTAVKNAQMAESPVLLIGGAAASVLKGRGALQDIDQMSLFKTVCKHCERVKNLRQIVPVIKRAIHIALSGVPGPVFVEIPIDILYPYYIVRRQMLGMHRPTSLLSRLLSWYLECYLSYVFYAAWEPRDMIPLPVEITLPLPALVEKTAELLAVSKCPLLLVGSQAMLCHDEVKHLQRAVKKIGIPTYLGGMARGLLGARSFIQMRHGRREALKKADFILLAGAVCDFRLEYGRSLSKKAVIVSVNRDYEQATMNAGTFWDPKLVVIGDVATFLVSLSTHLELFRCNTNWLARLKDKDAARDLANIELSKHSNGVLLNPLRVLFELDRVLPDNAILVADGGDFVGCASYVLRPRGPLQWLDPGAFGTLGVGGGFALGAKVTFPDAQVWIIYGDGSCAYSIAEYDTFTRHNLPILGVVGNDAGWTQIEREQKPVFGSSVACVLARTNYHIVARGYGAEGILCGCTGEVPLSPGDIFEAAIGISEAGKSVLINAWIGKTAFRNGSISV